ncbi:MAG: phosphotransferase family protein [Alphaproteobacteria bacterium]|nr:phosphotransferase family protein [Alphaproteobacteria bacterium]
MADEIEKKSADRQARFSGTMPIRDAHQIDVTALERFMVANVAEFRGPLTVAQFRGGQSNPTYQVSAPSGKYVVRRKPPGKLLPSAHAVDREHRVIAALQGTGVPVPKAYAFCSDETVIGTAFYVMEYVEGRVLWDLTLPGTTISERAAIFDQMNAGIAKLHRVDYRAVGLGDYGKPGEYVARQVARWTKQYRASETESIPAMERLIEWLPAAMPNEEETTLVHGDYRLDNMIFHSTEPRLLAILDWEISTLGHPIADFAYHCMPWRLPPETERGFAGLDLAALGIPSEQAYLERYCARTGRPLPRNWEFYIAYNIFRFAAILQGIMGRVKDGTAASKYAHETGAMARTFGEIAWDYAKAIGR